MMKLGKLVNQKFINALQALNQKELPAVMAYQISKIVIRAQEEQAGFHKMRESVIDKHVKKNKDGSRKTKTRDGRQVLDFGGNEEKLVKELDDLSELSVDLPKIKLSDLLSAGLIVSGANLNDLMGIILDDVNPKEEKTSASTPKIKKVLKK